MAKSLVNQGSMVLQFCEHQRKLRKELRGVFGFQYDGALAQGAFLQLVNSYGALVLHASLLELYGVPWEYDDRRP